jgi:hypothetical protein
MRRVSVAQPATSWTRCAARQHAMNEAVSQPKLVTEYQAEMGSKQQQQQHCAHHVDPQGDLGRLRRRADRIGQVPKTEQPNLVARHDIDEAAQRHNQEGPIEQLLGAMDDLLLERRQRRRPRRQFTDSAVGEAREHHEEGHEPERLVPVVVGVLTETQRRRLGWRV